jgi:CheY-like chemotaxis protein
MSLLTGDGAARMKRILFVDDDATFLERLRDALRPWRQEWRATFARDGVAALEALAVASFDVVVCDMRRPAGRRAC